MSHRSVFLFEVQRELERNLLIGTHADPARHGKSEGLEIEPPPRPTLLHHLGRGTAAVMEGRAADRCHVDDGVHT